MYFPVATVRKKHVKKTQCCAVYHMSRWSRQAPPGNELEVARIMASAQVKAAQVQAEDHNTATTRLAMA